MTALGVIGVTTPAERLTKGGVGGSNLLSAPPGPGRHHINVVASAFGAEWPRPSTEHGRFGAVPSSHLGRVGLNLMTATLAPHD